MPAWQFARRCTCSAQHGWARFVSMQDHYNLLAREEEREMLPLCADEGVGTIVWSPLARGRLARAVGRQPTARSAADPFADMLYTNAEQRPRHRRRRRRRRRRPAGVTPRAGRAGLAAPQPGRRRAARRRQQHRPDRRRRRVARHRPDRRGDPPTLEAHYTPRYDFQGISDDAELERIMARLPGFTPARD